MRRNKNRGYQQLIVWQDAVSYYRLTAGIFRPAGFELGKIISQQLASADSVHRNIAEGYCRRSIKEYIQFLYIAMGSLGESVSAQIAYRDADNSLLKTSKNSTRWLTRSRTACSG